MIKKILLPFFFVLFLFLVPPALYVLDYSQTINISQDKVVYNLPYAGLLPDHPLYFVKAVRDRVLEVTTRDNLKKAELYLLYSDKRTSMALALAKKGKDNLAISTLSKAEKYFLKIPKLIDDSRKQGVSAPSEMIDNLKLSNAKHTEMIQTLLKELPQGKDDAINEILKINQDVKKQLEKL